MNTTYKVTAVGFRGYAQGDEFDADDLTEDEERDFTERGWIRAVKPKTKNKAKQEEDDG